MNELWEEYGFTDGHADYGKAGYLRYVALMRAANERYVTADANGNRTPFEISPPPVDTFALRNLTIACNDMNFRGSYGEIITLNDAPVMRGTGYYLPSINRMSGKSGIGNRRFPEYINYFTRTYALTASYPEVVTALYLPYTTEYTSNELRTSDIISHFKTAMTTAVPTAQNGQFDEETHSFVRFTKSGNEWEVKKQIALPYKLVYSPAYSVRKNICDTYATIIEVSIDGMTVIREKMMSATAFTADSEPSAYGEIVFNDVVSLINSYLDKLDVSKLTDYSNTISIDVWKYPLVFVGDVVNGREITLSALTPDGFSFDEICFPVDSISSAYWRFDVDGGFEFY